MIDGMVMTGILATGYLLVGIFLAHVTQIQVNDAVAENGHDPYLWGLYVSFMVALLWPIFVFLVVLATGYDGLTGEVE